MSGAGSVSALPPDAAECGFAGSPLPVAWIDLDHARILDANAAAAALYGLPADRLAGCPLAELLAPSDTAGVRVGDRADAAAAFVRQALAPGASAFECRHRRPDGRPWLAELRVVRVEPGPPRRLLCTLQDVTAQREHTHELRRLEQRYALAARIGRVAAWELWPAEGRIFYDASLSRLMGYEPEDLGPHLGAWRETIPQPAREAVRAALQAVVEGRSDGYSVEHPVLRKDGSIGWVHVQGERVSAPGERPLRVVGSTVDITERKRFERDLELTQFAVDHSPNAIFWINDQGRVVRANQRAGASLGLDPEALKGRAIWSFDPDFSPQAWAPLMQRLQREGSVVFETRHRRADGTEFPVEITTAHIPFDGKDYGFCVVRDITERKRAEQALRELNAALEQRVAERTAELALQSHRNEMILASAIDGFFTVDGDGRVRDVNPAFCRMLGYTREELLARAIADFEADEAPHEVAARIEAVYRQGHARFDTRHRHQDGHAVDVEVSATKVELAGAPLLFAFVRDISERKRAELALRQARDEAERANLAKSEFLSRMSHELRTPLNAILGFGQLLELRAGGSPQGAHAREILNAGRHLLTLIDEVLDLSRVESGNLPVSPEPVAVAPLVEDCLSLLRHAAAARAIRLPDPGPACSVHVLADRTRLKQVLLNLLSNAVKYNRDQGNVDVVCVHEPDAAPAVVCIRISDTGPGVSAEQQARLFVPFERLDAEARQIPGTGIGLALSKHLVELMGGAIGVQSTPGAGTTFWIRLPLAPAPAAPLPPAAADEAPADGPAADTRHDLLYIEDNPANLRLIEGVFARRPDIRLLTAMAPGLGLELARSHRPALILLDLNLPDMDGYAVLQSLRQHDATRDIPVVAVSANAMPRDLARGQEAGFAAYLTKPLDIAQLLRVVDRLLSAPAG